MISITVENLVTRYGSFVALDRINLRVEPGELFFLLGPSGCGKTTLLRTLAGFSTPDEGRVVFGDQDVTNVAAHLRETAMMFQSYALWPHLTVAGNVRFGLEERRVPRKEMAQRTQDALESVKMSEYADRRIGELSGGQQQRVALARALVVRPRALLLDEPLSNLDAKLRLEMRGEIRRICKEAGLTAIYVTHDQKEALSISDRMALMNQGRIVQVGTPEEIYRLPRTQTVADFVGETNFIPGTIRALSSKSISVETEIGLFEGVKSDPDWQPKESEAIILSIRPECWHLQNDLKTVNCIRGRISASTYLGETAQHRIRQEGVELKIYELNPRPSERKPEQDIFAQVRMEDVVILRKEG